MEEKIYTLNLRQAGQWQYENTVSEIGVMKPAPTLDIALTITLRGRLKHLTTRYLILVFVDQHFNETGWFIDPQERAQTVLEQQAAFEVGQLRIAPQVKRRERYLVFELSRPLKLEQAIWLDEHAGKLVDGYQIKDELEVQLDALLEEAHNNRKAAAHE